MLTLHKPTRPTVATGQPTWPAIASILWVGLVATVATHMVAPPADPDAVWAPWAEVVAAIYTVALMSAIVGLGLRRVWGVGAAAVVGVAMVAASVGCFAEGHRALFLWVQLAGGGLLAAVSVRHLPTSSA